MSNHRTPPFDDDEHGERSYFEIKVTFVHIVVMLVSVVMIGILLFYLGYRAGHAASLRPAAGGTTQTATNPPGEPNATADAIAQEMRLHRPEPEAAAGDSSPVGDKSPVPERLPATESPADENPPPATHAATGPATTGGKFTIQIGAFTDMKAARQEAQRFAELGLPIEIIAEVVKGTNYQTVRVGRFATKAEAQQEKARLERMGNKKFLIKSVREK
ncbi:MAG TPA: SPOR domain-containing protein [Candidatus Aminicenantes bacterium]|nr:SPOR domain-containing protein [Candidatus Aminicenantes bacterium]